jgi:tetratricopeptide repeat protein 21B
MTLPELNFSLPSKKDGEAKTASYSTNAGLENMNAHSDVLSGAPTVSVYSDSLRLTDDDRVGAFVCYASLLGKSRRMKEANKVLSHAKVVFAGSAQEVQVLVAASQLFVEKGDFDAAIRMLDKISEDSPTFARAQLIKADIVLNHNHDKEGFTKCYQQLADKEPSAKNYALLGEAYLRILNPEAAIDALEQAYKLDPKNGRLRGRIGKFCEAARAYSLFC